MSRSEEREQISAERLLEAAEAAERAAAEVSAYTGEQDIYPADLMGHPLQPDYLAEFTKFEMEEACAFLVRMGMLQPRSAEKQKHGQGNGNGAK